MEVSDWWVNYRSCRFCDCPTLLAFPFLGLGMCLYFHDGQLLKLLQNTDITEVRGNRTRLISNLLPCVSCSCLWTGPCYLSPHFLFSSLWPGLCPSNPSTRQARRKTTEQRFMNQFSQMLQVKSL